MQKKTRTISQTKSLTRSYPYLNDCSDDIKFGDMVNITTSNYKILDPKISFYDNGNYVTAWREAHESTIKVIAQLFNQSNLPLSEKIEITSHPFLGYIAINSFYNNYEDFVISWSTLPTSFSKWQIHSRYFLNIGNFSYNVSYEFDSLEAIKGTRGRFAVSQYNNSIYISSIENATTVKTSRFDITNTSANLIYNITETSCNTGNQFIISATTTQNLLSLVWSTPTNIHAQHYDIVKGDKVGQSINIISQPLKITMDAKNSTTIIAWENINFVCGLTQTEKIQTYYAQIFNSNGTQISNVIPISNYSTSSLQQIYLINNQTFSATFTDDEDVIFNIYTYKGDLLTFNYKEINVTAPKSSSVPITQRHKFQTLDFRFSSVSFKDLAGNLLLTRSFISSLKEYSFNINNKFIDDTFLILVSAAIAKIGSMLAYASEGQNVDQCIVDCNSISNNLASLTKKASIDKEISKEIQTYLDKCGDLTLSYESKVDIEANLQWSTNYDFTIKSKHNITFMDNVIWENRGTGTLKLMAGIESDDHTATVNFADNTRIFSPEGNVRLYYNPIGSKYKYHNAIYVGQFVEPPSAGKGYMFINSCSDLRKVMFSMHSNYALSGDLIVSNEYCNTTNHKPVVAYYNVNRTQIPFSGNFDGNGFIIKEMNISYPDKDTIGFFGYCSGSNTYPSIIENVIINDSYILARTKVGSLCGLAKYVHFYNIKISNTVIAAEQHAGGLIGTAIGCHIKNLDIINLVVSGINNGSVCGKALGTELYNVFEDNSSPLIGEDFFYK